MPEARSDDLDLMSPDPAQPRERTGGRLKKGECNTPIRLIDLRDSERITDGQPCQWCRTAGEESPAKTKGGPAGRPFYEDL
jgi:hypothetical protein